MVKSQTLFSMLFWNATQAFYAKVVDWFNAKFNCPTKINK